MLHILRFKLIGAERKNYAKAIYRFFSLMWKWWLNIETRCVKHNRNTRIKFRILLKFNIFISQILLLQYFSSFLFLYQVNIIRIKQFQIQPNLTKQFCEKLRVHKNSQSFYLTSVVSKGLQSLLQGYRSSKQWSPISRLFRLFVVTRTDPFTPLI